MPSINVRTGEKPADGPVSTRSAECPRQESNLRTRFRKPLLYPLSYGGSRPEGSAADAAFARVRTCPRSAGDRRRGSRGNHGFTRVKTAAHPLSYGGSRPEGSAAD